MPLSPKHQGCTGESETSSTPLEYVLRYAVLSTSAISSVACSEVGDGRAECWPPVGDSSVRSRHYLEIVTQLSSLLKSIAAASLEHALCDRFLIVVHHLRACAPRAVDTHCAQAACTAMLAHAWAEQPSKLTHKPYIGLLDVLLVEC